MVKNLYNDIPAILPEELIETITQSNTVRIERIVSDGHCSETNFWYDQKESEFVVLLSGSAVLQYEADDSFQELAVGDYVLIPPHCRHRVEATDSENKTVWLAVFF